MTISIFYITRFFVNFIQNRIRVNTIDFLGNKFELDDFTKSGLFDKNIHQIVSLIENSDVETFVFEDLDRYDTNLIFTKLKEINDFLNHKTTISPDKVRKLDRKLTIKQGYIKLIEKYSKSKPNEPSNPVKFIYLIKDDIFTANDRTKFFDFIIPTVPVINQFNSRNLLLDLLYNIHENSEENDGKQRDYSNINEKYGKGFLRDISVFIMDMRMLQNIVNEFQIYYSALNNDSINLPILLSVIIYKNLHPRDFSLLQNGEGYLINSLRRFSELNEYDFPDIKSLEDLGVFGKKDLDNVISHSFHDESGSIITNSTLIGDNKYIQYLVFNNLINIRTVSEYLSYFYPHSLTHTDTRFINDIVNNQEVTYDLKLDDPGSIMLELVENDYAKSQILNYDYFLYLIRDNNDDEL